MEKIHLSVDVTRERLQDLVKKGTHVKSNSVALVDRLSLLTKGTGNLIVCSKTVKIGEDHLDEIGFSNDFSTIYYGDTHSFSIVTIEPVTLDPIHGTTVPHAERLSHYCSDTSKVYCSNCKYFKDNSSYNKEEGSESICDHPMNYEIVEGPLSARMEAIKPPQWLNRRNNCHNYTPNLLTKINTFFTNLIKGK